VNGVLLMMLVALPLAAVVVWALARRRRAGGDSSAWRRSLAEVGIVHGTVPFLWMTMMSDREPASCPAGPAWSRCRSSSQWGRSGRTPEIED